MRGRNTDRMAFFFFYRTICLCFLLSRYALYANQELRALGLSNLAGAGFNAYPATGSFSRSAVSNDTGCKTQLGSIVTALLVLLVVLFITKPFYYMPMSALGAIVISGVIGLLDIEEALYLFRLSKMDFLVWMTSFFGTLFGGAELGLGIAVGLALLIGPAQAAGHMDDKPVIRGALEELCSDRDVADRVLALLPARLRAY